MRQPQRPCFWVETAFGSTTALFTLVTLVWRDWIEIVLRVDPDHGSGTLELLIVGALSVVTVVTLVAASAEYRRSLSPA